MRIPTIDNLTQACKKADPITDNDLAMHLTSKDIDIEIVKLALENKNTSVFRNNLMKWASHFGRYEIVKILLVQYWDVDPSSENNKSIRWAFDAQNFNIVVLLMSDKRINPDTFLFADDLIDSAIDNNECGVIEIFLQKTSSSKYHKKIFKFACEYGYPNIIKLLLKDKRINPSDQNNYAIKETRKKFLEDQTSKNFEISSNKFHKIIVRLLNDTRVNPENFSEEEFFKVNSGINSINMEPDRQMYHLKDIPNKSPPNLNIETKSKNGEVTYIFSMHISDVYKVKIKFKKDMEKTILYKNDKFYHLIVKQGSSKIWCDLMIKREYPNINDLDFYLSAFSWYDLL